MNDNPEGSINTASYFYTAYKCGHKKLQNIFFSIDLNLCTETTSNFQCLVILSLNSVFLMYYCYKDFEYLWMFNSIVNDCLSPGAVRKVTLWRTFLARVMKRRSLKALLRPMSRLRPGRRRRRQVRMMGQTVRVASPALIMRGSANCKTPPISLVFFCLCDKVYYKQEVPFLLYLLGQIVT